MARQQNVQQQNALTTAGILKAASYFQGSGRLVAWLRAALKSRGDAADSGLLVAFSTIPDQGGGDQVAGTWLTTDRRFWKFEAVVPRQDNETVDIERLEDVTLSMLASSHVPGTGKSFAQLALEVLETMGQSCGR